MISTRLRNWLAAVSILIMLGGPLFVVLSDLAVGAGSGARTGQIVGGGLRSMVLCVLVGGVLRLLVSIDARLEARP